MEDVRYRRREPAGELKALAAVVVALVLVLAGARWLTQHRPEPSPAAAEAPRRSSADDPVVIEVNGEPIYKSEFDAAVASLPPQMRAQVVSEESRREVAEELVKMKVLEQEARRLKLDDDGSINSRVSVMRGNLLASSALQKLLRDTKPLTTEELYARNQERFETARVRSILLPYQGSRATPRQGQAAPAPQVLAKARQLVERLRRGESFEKIAAAESVGSAELGEVRRGSFMPELDKAIFSTPAGQISGPVQSPFGIHIFLIAERKAPKLEEVRAVLEREAQNLQAAAIVEDLRKNAKVQYKPE